MILFLKYTFKNSYRFLTDKSYRTFLRLLITKGNKRRYEPCRISIHGYEFKIPDALSFVWQYKEIFVDKSYEFKTAVNNPIIIDCGANVGMSALFFSKRYPGATVVAFEADPVISNYLKDNIEKNKISNVQVINKAVWINNEELEFGSEGSDGGSIHSLSGKKIKIKSIRLKEVIESYISVDMLKMDIEGAEREVINDCIDVLHKVKNIFIEYHDFFTDAQYLSRLTAALEENEFRYFISATHSKKTPMQPDLNGKGMDLQLNIFATKLKD